MDANFYRYNANFLRELAESLPRIRPDANIIQHVALLQRLADNELAEAERIDAVRAMVAAARADTRPYMDSATVRELLRTGLAPTPSK
ncbi:plasmid stabilization protein [Stenotrophomonas acidaminiphila]|uniref:plasmid stabilization protein n=1 Tax=Stenotrophomonas acidaminiphila TaxID=128780 RepID=UPI001FAF4DD2|nr:plasmid stabilization protein [Stenotrophomonas acidaminiphila]